MAKTCPKCKLINPESASHCDCGYEFATGIVKYLKSVDTSGMEKKRRSSNTVRWLDEDLRILILILIGLLILIIPIIFFITSFEDR